MQSVIGVMSFMGSIMLLCCYLLRLFAPRLFSARGEYRLLKVCLVFFLVPFPLVKNYLFQLYKKVGIRIPQHKIAGLIEMDRAIPISPNAQIVLPADVSVMIIMIVLWSIGFLTVLLYHLQGYLKMKHYMMRNTEPIRDSQLREQTEQLKRDYKIHRKISYLRSNMVKTPFTMGLFTTLIILPEDAADEERMKYILAHELTHVKQSDFLIRLAGLLAVAVHWFNPFAYLLFWELSKRNEYACDEKVVLPLNEAQRVLYGHMILDMSSHQIVEGRSGMTLTHSFGTNNKKRMKERLLKMKYAKKRKLSKCIIAGVAAGCISMLSFTTVFAYKDLVIIEGLNAESEVGGTLKIPPQQGQDLAKKEQIDLPDAEVLTYYIDQNGTCHIVDEQSNNTEKSSCNHSYYDGEVTQHVKNSDGSCKEIYYQAQICASCGNTITGSIIMTTTETYCPH